MPRYIPAAAVLKDVDGGRHALVPDAHEPTIEWLTRNGVDPWRIVANGDTVLSVEGGIMTWPRTVQDAAGKTPHDPYTGRLYTETVQTPVMGWPAGLEWVAGA
jgi:hypothetical protein